MVGGRVGSANLFYNMEDNKWIIGGSIIFFSLMAWGWKLLNKKIIHRFYILQAQKVLKKIQVIIGEREEARKLNYLRKINPYVFEEVLLLAFEKKGYKVIRNKRYSGDGGVDGMVIIEGHRIPIQAKRYKKYIRKVHVQSFENLVMERKAPYGLFIHTGKTGKESREENFPHVKIISGRKLLNLLAP